MTTISKDRLENILKRGQDLEQRLMDPAVMNNPNQLRTLSREKAQLDPLLSLAEEYLSQQKELLDLNQQ
jgi:peptide chain release factor 1